MKPLDAISAYYLEKRIMCPYDAKRIAWELDETASGRAYYGNALRVAKDFDCLTDMDRSTLDKYATGKAGLDPKNTLEDKFRLQEIATKIRAQATTEKGEG